MGLGLQRRACRPKNCGVSYDDDDDEDDDDEDDDDDDDDI